MLDKHTVFDYVKPDSRNRISLNWINKLDLIIHPIYKIERDGDGKITLTPINLSDNSFMQNKIK